MKSIHNNKGISLIEIIVSIGILALLLVPTISLFAASMTNNRITQASIEAKYLAEECMELICAAQIKDLNDLDAFLDDALALGGFIPALDEVGDRIANAYTRSGFLVTASCTEDTAVSTGSDRFDDTNNFFDLNGITGNITITVRPSSVVPGSVVAEVTGAVAALPAVTMLEPELNLFFENSNTITVINETVEKLNIFCINASVNAEGEVEFHDNRTIPTFIIEEGRVAFYDYTEPVVKLPEELLLNVGEQLTVSYDVVVTVSNNEAYYELAGIKTIQ